MMIVFYRTTVKLPHTTNINVCLCLLCFQTFNQRIFILAEYLKSFSFDSNRFIIDSHYKSGKVVDVDGVLVELHLLQTETLNTPDLALLA